MFGFDKPTQGPDDLPGTARLVELMAKMQEKKPYGGPMRAAFQALLDATLVAIAVCRDSEGKRWSAPPGAHSSQLPPGYGVVFEVTENRQGAKFITVFTAWQKLAAFPGNPPGIAVPAKYALTAVLQGQYHGLVVDPPGAPGFIVNNTQAALLLAGELPPE